jgi:TDG/mug DNA glycosylase family protein
MKKEELEESASVEVLTGVPDYVKEDMDLLIVGSNPGRMSSQKAQHFAHPSNHFYRTLHGSTLTPNLVPANFDYTMLDQTRPFYSIGLTNLAARPTRMAHELDKRENAEGAKILLALIRRYRPRLACFIGIGVARAFEKSLGDVTDTVKKDDRRARKKHQRDADDHAPVTVTIPSNVPTTDDKDMGLGVGLMTIAVRHNWDDTKVENQQNGRAPPYTLLFASPSTSGRVTSHQLPQKTECMRRVRILLDYWEQGERLAATRDVAITLI